MNNEEFRSRLLEMAGANGVPAEEPVQPLRQQISQLTQQVAGLRNAVQQQKEREAGNARPASLVEAGENKTLREAANIGRSVGTGLTFAPLVQGLVKLFGGKGQGDPAPLPVYIAPAPVQVEGTVTSRTAGAVSEVSYGPGGLPRESGREHDRTMPPVTIHVQAIDSRSFLDHSESIARAVREAMLHSSSLNDVVSEL
jgi:hypothetical protein